jgi:hypothetical protein
VADDFFLFVAFQRLLLQAGEDTRFTTVVDDLLDRLLSCPSDELVGVS